LNDSKRNDNLGASDVIPADQAARMRDFGSDLDEDESADNNKVLLVVDNGNSQNMSMESIDQSNQKVKKLFSSTHDLVGQQDETLFLGLTKSDNHAKAPSMVMSRSMSGANLYMSPLVGRRKTSFNEQTGINNVSGMD